MSAPPDDANAVAGADETASVASCGQLASGKTLVAGQAITSCRGGYKLVMQTDGNLVLYSLRHPRAIWASNTNGKGGNRAVMQGDGNLVIYTASTHAVWASGTNNHPGASLTVQDDANTVIYAGGHPVWATNTAGADCGLLGIGESLKAGAALSSCSGAYELTMQTDGNLVLYAMPAHHALWASHTNGRGGVIATMQGDGNLVVYDGADHPLWASNTNGKPGSYLLVQGDGNTVIYQGSHAVWATNTVQGPSLHTGDDYPSAWKNSGKDAFATMWGYNRECVSFAAWKIYENSGGRQVPTNSNLPSDWATYSINVDQDWGDAYYWSQWAAYTGVPEDNHPTPGSIAQWNIHDDIGMTVGHVGVVKQVYSDGSIDIEQYNLREDGLYSVLHMPKNSSATDTSNGHGPWTVPWPDNFIHIHGR